MTEPRPLCHECEDMIDETSLIWLGNRPFHKKCVTTIDLERRGMESLVQYLERNNLRWEASDKKTYDLKVEGKYVELKATTQAFFGLTENQYAGLESGELHTVFVVNGDQVLEYDRNELLESEPKVEKTYYYYHSKLSPTGHATCSGMIGEMNWMKESKD